MPIPLDDRLPSCGFVILISYVRTRARNTQLLVSSEETTPLTLWVWVECPELYARPWVVRAVNPPYMLLEPFQSTDKPIAVDMRGGFAYVRANREYRRYCISMEMAKIEAEEEESRRVGRGVLGTYGYNG